ncbi:MAG: KamA family radical SAM protein [Planctomycetota bacterium]|nr:MAG: KamA family radical SAM protein [Planctomycetota bacterium]
MSESQSQELRQESSSIAPSPLVRFTAGAGKKRSVRRPKYLSRAENLPQLDAEEKALARQVADKFVFRSNEYYQSLIDWDDPDDPIRRIIMPHESELEDWGQLDASDEASYTKAPGLEHKYSDTALLLVNDICGGYCRFCFRKRLFMDENDEVVRDVRHGLEYIRAHKEISNVLLTGGDPLVLATARLRPVLRALREIEHVQIIRIGSKMPAFNPFRISEDPSLLECLGEYSTPQKRIYLMAHFNHPRELTPQAIGVMGMLQQAGVITVNQSPLLRGINDDPDTLATLFDKLSFIGVPPYYMFCGRPTEGNRIYTLPIEQAYKIFEEARRRSSGLAKRAKLAMSHRSGKIEVMAVAGGMTFFKYHRAADPSMMGQVLAFPNQPEATWFDDYQEPLWSEALQY